MHRLLITTPLLWTCVLFLTTVYADESTPQKPPKVLVESPFPQVYRTFIPGAGPSSFAVQFSPDLGLSYDPLRGGVDEVWRGKADLTPTTQRKIIQPAELPDERFYKETIVQPLHLGSPDKKAERRFNGYRYGDNAVVFEFTIDGHLITETLRITTDGKGVERIFQLPKDGGDAFLQVEKQSSSTLKIEGGREVSPGLHKFPAGGQFSLLITPLAKKKAVKTETTDMTPPEVSDIALRISAIADPSPILR